MNDIKWIKLSVNMFNDEKIKLIRTMPEGDKIIVTWVQLLCLAGKTNDSGGIYMGQNIYYTDEMLATLCDQPVNIMRIALKTLEQFGMIEWLETGLIQIVNWERHQSTDKMAQIKEQNRIRQQKYYYRNQLRLLGYEESDMPNDLNELKELAEKPNVSMTLPNDTEVRSKKLEVRSKKKESNSRNSTKVKYDDDSPYMKLSKYLYAKMLDNNDKAKEPNYQKWADDMRKLVELDKHDVKEVAKVIEFSQSSTFWYANILSAKKLREKYDTLYLQSTDNKNKNTQQSVSDLLDEI